MYRFGARDRVFSYRNQHPGECAIEFEVRALASDAEYDTCLDLQEQTWGEGFSELVPPGILKIVQKVGGIAAGAFDADGRMAGFVFGISGVRHDRPAHWSHMLAVRPDLRNSGLGLRLKEYQRDRLLELGIEHMCWTYDPLVARNAHFNINKLGVTIDQYVEDMYTGGDRGPLDSVIGTDRFIVDWDLNASKPPHASEITGLAPAVVARSETTAPLVALDALGTRNEAYIEIPEDIHELKSADPEAARQWRLATREAFTRLLGAGFLVAGFGRQAGNGRCAYVLRRETR